MPAVLGTFSASVCWGEAVALVVVYTQDQEGYVRESQWNGSAWIGVDKLFRAKLGAPLAAIGIMGSDLAVAPNIRLYWVNTNNILQEHCFDIDRVGWYRGPLCDANIVLHPQSRIAACTLGKEHRVYFQEPINAAIQEWKWDGATWAIGTTLPVAKPFNSPYPAKPKVGTPLTACYNIGAPRVYYITEDNFVREQYWDDPIWRVGPFVYPVRTSPATGLAIVAHAATDKPTGTTDMYLGWPKGEITQSTWDFYRSSLPLQVGTATGIPGTNISACSSAANPKFKRVYFQNSPSTVGELCNDGGAWYFGTGVPIP